MPTTIVSSPSPQCAPQNNVGNFDLSSVFHVQKDVLLDTAVRNTTAGDEPQIVEYVDNVQKKLDTLSNNFKDANTSSQAVLAHQQQMLDIVRAEKARLEEKKQLVDSADIQQQHVMVLNNTYRKQYTDYTKIIIVVVIGISVHILLRMLVNFLQVPEFISILLHIVNVVICAIVITTIYATMQVRSKIDYDKIELPPPNTGPSASSSSSDISNSSLFGQFCWGEQCCDSNNGVVWNARLGMCELKKAPAPAPAPTPAPEQAPPPGSAPTGFTFSFQPLPGLTPATPPAPASLFSQQSGPTPLNNLVRQQIGAASGAASGTASGAAREPFQSSMLPLRNSEPFQSMYNDPFEPYGRYV